MAITLNLMIMLNSTRNYVTYPTSQSMGTSCTSKRRVILAIHAYPTIAQKTNTAIANSAVLPSQRPRQIHRHIGISRPIIINVSRSRDSSSLNSTPRHQIPVIE